MTGKKIRVGIIGVGGVANGIHMPGYRNLDDVEMVAFCDIIRERAEKGARDFGTQDARVYEDYDEMLRNEQLDAVSVCTPNDVHAPATVAALKAGVNVLCEKPMAKTPAEAREMLKAARESGKLLTIGYQNRLTDDARLAKEMIEAGELGEIYFAKAVALRRRGVPTWGVFLSKERQGGGPLIDIGTHALDLTLWLMGNPRPVLVAGASYRKLVDVVQYNRWGSWKPEEFEVEDSAFGFVRLENGATVIVEASWALNIPDDRQMKGAILCGTKGGAEVLGGKLRLNSEKRGRLFESAPVPHKQETGPHAKEIAYFIEAVKGEREVIVKPSEALMVTEILDAIYESERTGKAIQL